MTPSTRTPIAVDAMAGAASEAADIVGRLREAGKGREEWRVADPETGAYCIAFDHVGCLNPEQEAREWLEDHVARFPNSPNARKVVMHEIARCSYDEMIIEAADTIQALREIADAARAVLAFRVNEPCRGDLRDTDKSRDALSVLDYAVAAYDSAMKG